MKRLGLSTLRLVLQIAEKGSLTEAANEASLTLAAVSKRLIDLEDEVGLPLFTRTAKGVLPTEAGLALVVHARKVLFEVDRLNANLSEFKQGQWGTVRIAGNTSAICQFLPEDLGAFIREHPNIRLELTELYSDEIIAALSNGTIDIGVFVGYVPHETIDSYKYRQDRLCIVTPLSSKLASKTKISFEEVLDMRFVGLEPDSPLLQLLLNKSKGRIKVAVQARSFDSVCRFVQAGVGIGVVPDVAARLYAPIMQLAVIELTDEWANRELLLGIRAKETLTAPARLVLDSLRR